MKRKVLIIYTGGTIGMEKNYETGSLEPFDFRYIFEKLPEVNLLQCEVAIHPFQKPLDSSDIGPKEWSEISPLVSKTITINMMVFWCYMVQIQCLTQHLHSVLC